MKKLLRALLLGGVAASLAVTVPLAACDVTVKDPCANGAHVDKDGNGICDNCTTPMPKPDECPNGGSHVDANGDGKCDKCGGMLCWHKTKENTKVCVECKNVVT